MKCNPQKEKTCGIAVRRKKKNSKELFTVVSIRMADTKSSMLPHNSNVS